MKRILVCLSVVVLSCGPGIAGGDNTTTLAEDLRRAALKLTISSPLTLSSTTLGKGATLTATVTYLNSGKVPYSFSAMSIESRPPGGTHEGGPFETLQPALGATTVQPGASITVSASRVFPAADSSGTWEAYSTFQRPDGVWVDGPSVSFTYAGANPPADAGTTPRVDGGTVPPVVDAGTTPSPDAGPPGALVEPVSPGAADVTFTIRADSDVHAISPLIYGVNQITNLATEQRGVGLVRAGGNRWTAYNWENNASNAGVDYLNQNDNYLSSSTAPGAAVKARVDPALASGAVALVTIPIQGYAAADTLGGGDVNQTSNYLQTRFKQTVSTKNAAFSLTPDTTDGYVYQDEFANWLKVQYPNAFAAGSPKILLTLDNEPDLWADSHPRIQPAVVAPEVLIAKNIEFATAVKAVIPTAIITGFVSYGYYGFIAFQGLFTSADFTSHYLDAMQAAEVAAKKRLIDVLDLHWYPEATGDGQRITGTGTTAGIVTARVQAPRSLWDPTYRETSWVANAEGGSLTLIPKMKARIAAHYPGTKLGFTEYSYGGGTHISGALAEADVLGVFGREDVYLANYWSLQSDTFIYAGMRAFTSYDEAGAHFGDTSVRAATSNVESTSVYASIDAAHPGRMVIVAINKTGAPVTAGLSLAAYGNYTSAKVYQVTSAGTSIQPAAAISAATRNGFLYQMPASSISVLVPQ